MTEQRRGDSSPLDEDLRSRFAALRRGEERSAPGFGALVSRLPSRIRRHGMLPATLAAAAVILTLASLHFATAPERLPSSQIAVPLIAPSILSWRSPTEALLQTPGRDLLHSVPTVQSSLLRDTPKQ